MLSKYYNFSFPGKVNSFTAIVVLVLLERFTVHKERKKERKESVLHQIHLVNLEARDLTANLLATDQKWSFELKNLQILTTGAFSVMM